MFPFTGAKYESSLLSDTLIRSAILPPREENQNNKTCFSGALQLLLCFCGQTMRRSFCVVFFFYFLFFLYKCCYPGAHNCRQSLLIHVLLPTRGVPKLCWEIANRLCCKHICRGALVEDRCQPAPALQAPGDQ